MRPLLPLNQNEELLKRALETAEETIRKLTLENSELRREIEALRERQERDIETSWR
jgi:prefoldin subunit 5